ncbi:MAG: hypothetical protein ER33_07140 [Cyanobium sp. CACIAM 14]|nr:MAG: hypothetical protein ER33_07140 [Cyanobium sp. CACIAM 14]
MVMVAGILAVAIVLFAWGRPRADIVGLLVVLALMATQILTPQEALAGFGSPVVILIAAIFIVSEGLVATGVAQRLGDAVVQLGKGSEARLITAVMLLAGSVGSVLNSSAIAAMFIPIVLRICSKTGLNHKRMLMPLGVAVMISGMMTLIASSPNIIVENALRARQLPPLSFFSWTPLGLVMLAISIVFMLFIGRDLLSRQVRADQEGDKAPTTSDILASYGLKELWHRVAILPGSPLIHQPLGQLEASLEEHDGLTIVGLERDRAGKTEFLPATPGSILENGDFVFVLARKDRLEEFVRSHGGRVVGELDEKRRQLALQELGVAEVMLAPESKGIGHTIGEAEIGPRYGLTVLAGRHRGESFCENLKTRTLDFGDTLLVAGAWEDINRLGREREEFLVLTLPAEAQDLLPARGRAPIAVAILVAMVAIMVFSLLPNAAAALVAALAMVATGCVRLDRIYRVISWSTIVLIAGMLPMATALDKTGATTLMARTLVKAMGPLGPDMMLAVVFLATALVGLFISNSATAVLIAPVAIEAARALHVSPQAFAMTVTIACSAAYVTPVSSPTNMLVMEPGGYAFSDYVKVGLPMLLLTMVATVLLVRFLFPF